MVAGFGRLALDLIMRSDADAVTKLKGDHYHHLISQADYETGMAAIRATHNGFLFDIWNIHWLYYCEGLFVLTAALMIVISLMTKRRIRRPSSSLGMVPRPRRRPPRAPVGTRWTSCSA